MFLLSAGVATNRLHIDNLHDVRDPNTLISGATVRVTLKDRDTDTEIAGAAWPLASSETAAGFYETIISSAVGANLTPGQRLVAEWEVNPADPNNAGFRRDYGRVSDR